MITNDELMIPEDVIIYCDELVKIYEASGYRVMALQGLDLQVKRGEMTALIGKSGSGKSTLLNMIGGLEGPTAGRLYVNGKNISRLKEKEMVRYRNQEVGFVWQKSSRNLFPYMTVIENVMAPMIFLKGKSKSKRQRAAELLEKVGMSAHADKLPGQLSGGEQQRVAIAVALANEPNILLADEPTGAVDKKTADVILSLFHELNRTMGLTILIVTHDMELSSRVDRTIMISDGKISTEKVRVEAADFSEDTHHVEFAVLDKAGRVQLTEDILAEAGIESDRVHISVENGKVVITS